MVAAGYALGPRLPSLFHDDEFVQLLCEALDAALASVVSVIDCLPAYLDPSTTPEDHVDWLATWVGITVDRGIGPLERRRLIKAALGLHARRGTAEGIAAGVAMWFGVEPEVLDSGAMGWSPVPDAPLPGSPGRPLVVRLYLHDPLSIDVRDLDAVVAALKPAHVRHVVEVLAASSAE